MEASSFSGGDTEVEEVIKKRNKEWTCRSRKIEMKKIENRRYRFTTFTKRRAGLFAKADSLSKLCGANIGIITFSPHGTPFVFGSPSVGYVIDKFLGDCGLSGLHLNEDGSRSSTESDGTGDSSSDVEIGELDSVGKKFWWDEPIEGLDLNELKQLKDSLMEWRNHISDTLQEARMKRVALRDFFAQDSTSSRQLGGDDCNLSPLNLSLRLR